jgi:hypothetical protein
VGISRRAYAAQRGVSESAVRKAIQSGRLSVEADGTIDPARADAQWAQQTDPSMQRGAHSLALGERTAASTAQAKAGMKPVPEAAVQAVRETVNEQGDEVAPGEAPNGEVSFMRARMANEVLKAQMQKVRLGKMKEQLIDRARALAMVFDLARRERDAWIGWPPRVAATMAAELGADPHRVEQVLDTHLREHLAEMSEVKVELR